MSTVEPAAAAPSTTAATGRTRAARRSRRGDVRAVQGVDPPGARAAPVVAPEGRPVRAARRRDDPGDRQRRHRLRHPRPAVRPHRDHHLPRLRRRVVGAAAVRRPRRPRRDLPRPAPARAAADVRPAAHRASTTWSPRSGAIATILFAFSFLPQVVLFVGNMLVSDSALDYFTGHLDVLWKVPVAVALLALYYAVIGVAIASLTDRRIVAGAAIIGLFLVTSIASGDPRRRGLRATATARSAALINVLRLAAVPPRPRVPRPRRPRVAARAASTNGGLFAVVVVRRRARRRLAVLLRRYRWVER